MDAPRAVDGDVHEGVGLRAATRAEGARLDQLGAEASRGGRIRPVHAELARILVACDAWAHGMLVQVSAGFTTQVPVSGVPASLASRKSSHWSSAYERGFV